MKKISNVIVGFVGEKGCGKTTAAKILSKYGFHAISITPKVEEYASLLFTKEELNKDYFRIISEMRQRGCSINRCYWINQVLINVTDNNPKIVIDDLELFEINPHIKVFQIFRPEISKNKYPDIPIIVNNGTKKDLERNILQTLKELL